MLVLMESQNNGPNFIVLNYSPSALKLEVSGFGHVWSISPCA